MGLVHGRLWAFGGLQARIVALLSATVTSNEYKRESLATAGHIAYGLHNNFVFDRFPDLSSLVISAIWSMSGYFSRMTNVVFRRQVYEFLLSHLMWSIVYIIIAINLNKGTSTYPCSELAQM